MDKILYGCTLTIALLIVIPFFIWIGAIVITASGGITIVGMPLFIAMAIIYNKYIKK